MATYLNSDIPPIYCKIRKEYLYDFEKHHGESEDCCIFSISSITDRALLFNIMLPNGACFGDCLYQRFFKKNLIEAKCPICLSTNFNCGIALVIILVFIALVF
jgi:hypothetical protein